MLNDQGCRAAPHDTFALKSLVFSADLNRKIPNWSEPGSGLQFCNSPTSCEAAARVKPKARLCEPWVALKTIVRSRGAATAFYIQRYFSSKSIP